MVFSSYSFIFLFLPLLLLCYFAVPRKKLAVRNIVLLLFSLVFYACGGLRAFPLLLVSCLLNYLSALLLSRRRGRRAVLTASVVLNLALLAYYKYAMFSVEVLNLFGLGLDVPNIALPVGISFFTFQGMSYTIDVYRGTAAVQKNPLKVALYIALFPQLVAGPIVRYTDVAQEIDRRHESIEEAADGLTRFCFGLAKKMLLANTLGELADAVFAVSGGGLTVGLAWLGALAYTGQIYFDFSGYSDMAIGLGRVFGFHFLENFNYPYISKSITEFWRRWHISLSSWFRDYVYIPLGGNRCTRARQILNLLIVWALTGFWHGAAWSFLVWGLYFAVLLILERYVYGQALERLPRLLRHLYALLFIVLGWVLFRAETLPAAFGYMRAMFGGAVLYDGRTLYYLREYGWVFLFAIPACLPIKQVLEAKWGDGMPRLLVSRLLAGILLILSFFQLVGSTFNPFIYFRF